MKRVLIVLTIMLCVLGTAWVVIASQGLKDLPTYPHGIGDFSGKALCGSRFVTEDEPEAVLAYYREAMPRIGWTYSPSDSVSMQRSSFVQGDNFAIITIVKQEANLTTVLVVLGSTHGPFVHCGEALSRNLHGFTPSA